MSKVAVLVAEMYNEFELWYPYYRLIEAGYEPVLVGPAARPMPARPGSWPRPSWRAGTPRPRISPGW